MKVDHEDALIVVEDYSTPFQVLVFYLIIV
jgi:hypothetical protein